MCTRGLKCDRRVPGNVSQLSLREEGRSRGSWCLQRVEYYAEANVVGPAHFVQERSTSLDERGWVDCARVQCMVNTVLNPVKRKTVFRKLRILQTEGVDNEH